MSEQSNICIHPDYWERTKTRARALLDELEQEGLTMKEVELIINHLHEEMTAAHHKMYNSTPFRRAKR